MLLTVFTKISMVDVRLVYKNVSVNNYFLKERTGREISKKRCIEKYCSFDKPREFSASWVYLNVVIWKN